MEGENDKETSIGFKVHESEKRRWMELAEKNGLSLSSFVRRGYEHSQARWKTT